MDAYVIHSRSFPEPAGKAREVVIILVTRKDNSYAVNALWRYTLVYF